MTKPDLPSGKPGAHLALLHTSRTISGREFRKLSFEHRLELVRAASGRRKYELLVEAPDSERLIQRLPAEEVYLLIKELGLPDVPDLLAGADSGQFVAFLDLDCWRGDLFDSQRALEWLAVLLESGEEKVLETAQDMEFPLLSLILKKEMAVVATPGDFDDEETRSQVGQQNAGYEVEYRDAESGKLIAAFLQFLQRHDPELFTRVLESVRWEPEAILEEENYRDRRIRLESLGFPDPFESMAIYTWSDPAGFDPAACRRVGSPDLPAGIAPTFVLSVAPAGGLLSEILARGIDDASAWDLTWLLNRVMIADRVEIGDPAQVREAAAEVFRYLNLALEHLCGGDVDLAGQLFARTYLQALFRLGFSLTLSLQRRARTLGNEYFGIWFDPPFRAFLDALGRKKPRYFQGVDDPSHAGERPFAGLRELHLAGEWLDRLEAQSRLFATGFPFQLPTPATVDLGGCQPESAEELALSAFFLTALANRLLGRDFLPAPLPSADLVRLHALLCRKGHIAELRTETMQWLENLETGAGAFADYCFGLWEEEFCALEPDDIDPRFIRSMIVAVGSGSENV